MAQVSPSKYSSLDFLIELQKWNYIGNGGKEYIAVEVDALIISKEEALFEKTCLDDYDYLCGLEDVDQDGVPYPTDADLIELEGVEILPTTIAEDLNQLFNAVVGVVVKIKTIKRKVLTMAKKAVTKMTKKLKEIKDKAKKDHTKSQGEIYDKTFMRDGEPLRFRVKPGRRTGELGKKIKVHAALDADLHIIASNTGNRSKFINTALRYFVESRAFRDYVANKS